MLTSILSNSSSRISEVRRYHRMLLGIENKLPRMTVSEELSMMKGLFFVYIYGAYEYSIISSVQKFLQTVNTFRHKNKELKPYFHSIVQDDLCKSLLTVGDGKKWSKRRDLFARIASDEIVIIDDSVLPNDGRNLKHKQLFDIWASLGCSAQLLPKDSLIGRLEEIVENRNAIAHGRESPVLVGSRYTCNDLEQVLNDVDELCLYFIKTLNDHLNNRSYLN